MNTALKIEGNSESELDSFLREVAKRLKIYGDSNHYNRENVLEELIFIILSAQTESYSYLQTFEDLFKQFPTWNALAKASEEQIAEAIKRGGLARKKASQIKRALEKINGDTGTLSLEFLKDFSESDAAKYLTSLPGIGNKSAACIMMYSLGKEVFPVDTHVWRVCRRLGITPLVPKPTDMQERDLEAKVPRDIRYSLHVNMISHGRQTCTTYYPKCDTCILADICPSLNKPDEVWGNWRQPKGVWANAMKNKTIKTKGN